MIRPVVLGVAAALLAPVPALACRCPSVAPAEAYAGAEVVVLGRVTAASRPRGGPSTATVIVRRAWKSPVEAAIRVTTERICGDVLTSDTDWLLFLRRDAGQFVMNRCIGGPSEETGPFLRWLDRNGVPAG